MTDAIASLCDMVKSYLKANVFYRHERWDASKMPDLSGCVAMVTGGNTGIGYESVLELARHGAKVYMASRVESRAKSAIAKIKEQVPGAHVEFVYFDLTILSTAKKTVEDFETKENRLDILINNAGIGLTPYELSPDGVELQACNGTGHFALTMNLLPILKRTSSLPGTHVRIVNVASNAHTYAGTPDFTSLDGLNLKSSSAWARYAQSKLSNILFNNQLQTLLEEDTNILCLAVHPGVVATEIQRGMLMSYPQLGPFVDAIQPYANFLLATPYAGAQTQLYAATSPEVEANNLRAAYLVPYGQVGRKNKLAQDPDGKLGQQFWSLCGKLLADAQMKEFQ